MKQEMKSFKLKHCLTNRKTGHTSVAKTIIIHGFYAEDAVARYVDQLEKEGIYTLDSDYSYMQVESSQNM